jgi:hypothetical protein
MRNLLTTTKRSQLMTAAILAVLSMLASPVASCVCSDHIEVDHAEVSTCEHFDGHSHHLQAYAGNSASPDDECTCCQLAPKAISKPKSVKLSKYSAVLAPMPEAADSVFLPVAPQHFAVAKPLPRLSAFYSSHSSRGPPRS